MSLNEKALLVVLNISQWTGRKLDRKATSTVQESHHTKDRVGNYTKKLLPGARELEVIVSQSGAIRKYFYEQTLPWMSDGSRIISSKNYMNFTKEFREKKNNFELAVDSFLSKYPVLRYEAKNKLGDLFNDAEYPTEEKLRRAFNCEVSFLPLPSVKDFRTEILDSEKDNFISKMKEVESAALKDCWTRLHDVVKRAAEKLNSPDAIFRDSLIDNITEMTALLPRLNITDDPALESARIEIEKIAGKMSPEVLRDNTLERKSAADSLNEITEKMKSFMGGN